MPHDHAHAQEHTHAHAHDHTHEHVHETAHETAVEGAPPDLAKVAILVNNWIDHNEGHRRTYLEWHDRLATADTPATVAALARVAELTDQATAELRLAAQELEGARPTRG